VKAILGVTHLNRRDWNELIFKDDADDKRFFVGLDEACPVR
jgi:hypothetical protein